MKLIEYGPWGGSQQGFGTYEIVDEASIGRLRRLRRGNRLHVGLGLIGNARILRA